MFSDTTTSESEVDEPRRRPRCFRERINFHLPDPEFTQRFRLTKTTTEFVLQRIGDLIAPKNFAGVGLSAEQRLLSALRFLACGGHYTTVGDAHGVSKTTIHNYVHDVVAAINSRLFDEIVDFPDQCDAVVNAYHQLASFPSVVGCVDGTLIRLQVPDRHEHQFVDRKGNHSINAMLLCGPDYRFYYACVRWPGSVHDARAFRRSSLRRRFDTGWRPAPRAVILGDSAYPCLEYLMPPINKPTPLTPQELAYNIAHKQTRVTVECSIGILKNRFLCLEKLRVSEPQFACAIVKACVVLHNLCSDILPDDVANLADMGQVGLENEDDIDEDDTAADQMGNIRQQQIIRSFNGI